MHQVCYENLTSGPKYQDDALQRDVIYLRTVGYYHNLVGIFQKEILTITLTNRGCVRVFTARVAVCYKHGSQQYVCM